MEDATARLRESLELLTAGPDARAELETNFTALEDSVGATQALDASIHPELVEAAHAYVTDVHALLRRQLALHAGRDAVGADVGEHHQSPAGRGRAIARVDPPGARAQAAAGKELLRLPPGRRRAGKIAARPRRHEPEAESLRAPGRDHREQPTPGGTEHLLELSAQVERQVANARILPGTG